MYRLILVLFFLTPLTFAQFTYKSVDVPGATETQVRGVNSSGEIVGYYKTTSCVDSSTQFPNCPVHGFKIVNGTLTKLMVRNSTSTAIMGVNDYGDLVGFCITPDGSHGFLWTHDNTVTLLNAPFGGPNSDAHTVAMGVNKALIVVGGLWFYNTPDPQGGWVWANGTFSTMDPGDTVPGTCCWGVNGVSNNGFLSGQNFYHDFVSAWFKSATDEDFYPVTTDTVGTAVNSNADVIGFMPGGQGYFAKKIERNEGGNDTEFTPRLIKVAFPGASNTYPLGLSDTRMVVGAYTNGTGTHGFVATPTF